MSLKDIKKIAKTKEGIIFLAHLKTWRDMITQELINSESGDMNVTQKAKIKLLNEIIASMEPKKKQPKVEDTRPHV